jgi:anhydro-N-acetylmuramic acid kinase
MNQQHYRAIGLMSGTSLDGLDLLAATFSRIDGKWHFEIESYDFVPYDDELHHTLKNAYQRSADELKNLDLRYGNWLGKQVNAFLAKLNPWVADLIGSHGHTIHHQPNAGIAVQIGNGPQMFNETGIPVVCDFRLQDVLLHGQGAPLVPIGDRLLFSEYQACLNLGGFANISFEQHNKRLAFDICPVNTVLNELCSELNVPFDDGGNIARSGKFIAPLYKRLNALPYYHQNPPKSMGREWVAHHIWPIINRTNKTADLLHTFTEHAALQIAKALTTINAVNTLVTGGGAYNSYLIERITKNTSAKIQLPGRELIEYKEALVFAFLAVLRVRNEVNCLSSVTGASRNHSSGRVYSA